MRPQRDHSLRRKQDRLARSGLFQQAIHPQVASQEADRKRNKMRVPRMQRPDAVGPERALLIGCQDDHPQETGRQGGEERG